MSDPERKSDASASESDTGSETEGPRLTESLELAADGVQINEAETRSVIIDIDDGPSSDNENSEISNEATESDGGVYWENSSATTVIDNEDAENIDGQMVTVADDAETERMSAVSKVTGTSAVTTVSEVAEDSSVTAVNETVTTIDSKISSLTAISETQSDLQANLNSDHPVITDSLNPIPEYDADIREILDTGRLSEPAPRPVISNASSSTSKAPSLLETPSRRFFTRWKISPEPDEVVTVDSQCRVTSPVRGQELVVYTAPLFQRLATSDNNNANANLPVLGTSPLPCEDSAAAECQDGSQAVDDAEPVDGTEPVAGTQDTGMRRISSADNYDMVCRICHDTPSKTNTVTPCLCKGSMGIVHRECLERWLSESLKTSCEICGYKYNTTRRPRYSGCTSVCAWLKNPVNQADTRNVFFDIACFFILTPLAVISAWLCVLGARHYTTMGQKARSDNLHGKPYEPVHRGKPHRYRGEDTSNSTWTSVGLLALTGTLLAAYYIWLFVAIRYHYQVWKDWKQRNYVITVLPIPPEDLAEAQHHHDTGHVGAQTGGNPPLQPVFRNRRSNPEIIDMGYFDLDAEASISGSMSPFSDLGSPVAGTSRAHHSIVRVHENDTSTTSTDTSSGSTGTTSSYSSSGEVSPRRDHHRHHHRDHGQQRVERKS